MTVASTGNSVSYPGNGVNTSFGFNFAFPGNVTLAQAATELVVTFTPASGPSQVLTYGFGPGNYQLGLNAPISPNPTGVGGTVVYNPLSQPIPLGSSILIQRVLPSTQGVSLQNQGTLWQQVIEQALDYLTMLEQQILSTVNKAILIPGTDPTGLNYTIPNVSARANQFLAFDANGNVVAAQGAGSLVLPPGAQTISSTWTFTSSGGIAVAATPTAQYQSYGGNSRNTYSGFVTGGSGSTVTLSANPTNYITSLPCCSNDQTIVSWCILVTSGSTTQVAFINGYNATTNTLTISGNVYDGAGNLIGPAFSPIPASGNTYVIDRLDYGVFRSNVDRSMWKFEAWNIGSTPQRQQFQPTGTAFSQTVIPLEINRLSALITVDYPIAGMGNVPIYISANSPTNSDPLSAFAASGQTPQIFSIYTLQSSGDSGNVSGFYPTTFPLTYQNFESVRFTPHVYSAGVISHNPAVLTAPTTWLGVGVGFSRTPATPLEVAGQATLSSGVGFPGGGAQSSGVLLSSSANFGIYWGSGAPGFAAAVGSIYMNSAGSTTSNRIYVNSSGGTTWTNVVTAT